VNDCGFISFYIFKSERLHFNHFFYLRKVNVCSVIFALYHHKDTSYMIAVYHRAYHQKLNDRSVSPLVSSRWNDCRFITAIASFKSSFFFLFLPLSVCDCLSKERDEGAEGRSVHQPKWQTNALRQLTKTNQPRVPPHTTHANHTSTTHPHSSASPRTSTRPSILTSTPSLSPPRSSFSDATIQRV
jgi:hypothetical protein